MDIDGDRGDDDQPKPSISQQETKSDCSVRAIDIFIIAGSVCGPLGNRVKHAYDRHAVASWRGEYGTSAMITAIGVGRWGLRRADDTFSAFARDLQHI